MIATIHQPDLFPWVAFFDKLGKADVWVVLDHVRNNPRDAAFWGRRVRILTDQGPHWISIPLSKPSERGIIGVPITDLTINVAAARQLTKCLQTIRESYARMPYFRDHFSLVTDYFNDPDPSLLSRNMQFISSVLRLLQMEPRFVFSSSLNLTSSKTHLLADIIGAVRADTYLCGQGARAYQDDRIFAQRGIEVRYNKFREIPYDQHRSLSFTPGLSILDALFSTPLEEIRSWLSASRESFAHGIQIPYGGT